MFAKADYRGLVCAFYSRPTCLYILLLSGMHSTFYMQRCSATPLVPRRQSSKHRNSSRLKKSGRRAACLAAPYIPLPRGGRVRPCTALALVRPLP